MGDEADRGIRRNVGKMKEKERRKPDCGVTGLGLDTFRKTKKRLYRGKIPGAVAFFLFLD